MNQQFEKKCPSCGQSNPADGQYCINCGNQLPNNINNPLSPAVAQASLIKSWYFWAFIIGIFVVVDLSLFIFLNMKKGSAASTPVDIELEMPIFSVNSGTYYDPQNVMINNGVIDENTSIYYTLDGSTPTESSYKYSKGQAIFIEETSTLKSIVYDDYGNKSDIAIASYEIKEPEVTKSYDDDDDYSYSANAGSSNSGSSSNNNSGSNSYSSGTNNSYYFPDSNTRLISESELYGMSERDLILARNEIFARHGRIFTTDYIRDYFNSQSWYTPLIDGDEFDANVNKYFNSVELQNVSTIKAYEDKMGYK